MPNATILLIDDDTDHQAIHAAALRHAGYNLLLTTDVTRGFAMARKEKPDLIVCDLHFEHAPSGLDLIEGLQADPGTRDIPLLAYSSFTDFHDARLRELGVRSLMKRGMTRELTETVAAMLAEEQLRRRSDAGE